MRMLIGFMMLTSAAACAAHTSPPATAPRPAVDAALSQEQGLHPRGVERVRREMFVMERERRLVTIAERIGHLRDRARTLGIRPDAPVADALTALEQLHAQAAATLVEARLRVGDDLETLEDSVDAAITDLDVRSGQVTLQLAFLAMS